MNRITGEVGQEYNASNNSITGAIDASLQITHRKRVDMQYYFFNRFVQKSHADDTVCIGVVHHLGRFYGVSQEEDVAPRSNCMTRFVKAVDYRLTKSRYRAMCIEYQFVCGY